MPSDPQLREMAKIMKESRLRMRSYDSEKLYAQAAHSIRATTSARSSGESCGVSASQRPK